MCTDVVAKGILAFFAPVLAPFEKTLVGVTVTQEAWVVPPQRLLPRQVHLDSSDIFGLCTCFPCCLSPRNFRIQLFIGHSGDRFGG